MVANTALQPTSPLTRAAAELTNPTLGEALMPVDSHSTHHRGQVNARIRELGVEPPIRI